MRSRRLAGLGPRRLAGLSPRRRVSLSTVAAAVALLVVAALALVGAEQLSARLSPPPPQDQLGPVILVPGYGGGTGGLSILAERLRAAGRVAFLARPATAPATFATRPMLWTAR